LHSFADVSSMLVDPLDHIARLAHFDARVPAPPSIGLRAYANTCTAMATKRDPGIPQTLVVRSNEIVQSDDRQ
jgi:hypothetical protein